MNIAKISNKYGSYRILLLTEGKRYPTKSLPLYTMESTLQHFFSTYKNVVLLEEEDFDKEADKRNGRNRIYPQKVSTGYQQRTYGT